MKRYRVLIAENIPGLNKGEMTIFEGMQRSFSALGEVEVAMFSHLPAIDAERYGSSLTIIPLPEILWFWGEQGFANSTARLLSSAVFLAEHVAYLLVRAVAPGMAPRLFHSPLWKAYADSDAVIFGHDGTFGIGGGVGMPVKLYPIFLPFFARHAGIRSVLYGGSIPRIDSEPPLKRRIFATLFGFSLARTDLITLRERESHRHGTAVIPDHPAMVVTTDLAFLMEPVPEPAARAILGREGVPLAGRPLIGMTVTREKAMKGYPGLPPAESYRRHTAMLAAVCDALVAEYDAEIVLLPHCIGWGDALDDRLVAADIAGRCRSREHVRVMTNEYRAQELKGMMGCFSFFIGERLHSVINAMTMHVPSVILSDSADQRLDIIRMFGQENAVCEIANLEAEQLLGAIRERWQNRAEIAAQLAEQTAIAREKAMQNGVLLGKLLAGPGS